MQPSRRRFVNAIRISQLIVLAAVVGLVAPLARGQAILDKTTLGQSQNDARDLQNSLIVPKRVSIKGEKTEQVDAQKLSSRSVKDAKFQGSLLDMGLGSTDDTDLHQEKASKSADTGGDGQNKDQKATSVRSDEKPAEKEKAPATKTDGDH